MVASMQVRIVSRRVISVSFLTLMATAGSVAQTANQDPTISDLQRQIQEMRLQMAKMQNRIADMEAKETADKNSSTDPILSQSQTLSTEALRSQLGEVTSSKEPTPFSYKGITLTPGGFLESTILVRTRNENADMANSYTTIPLNGSSNTHLSEFRAKRPGTQVRTVTVQANFEGAGCVRNPAPRLNAWRCNVIYAPR